MPVRHPSRHGHLHMPQQGCQCLDVDNSVLKTKLWQPAMLAGIQKSLWRCCSLVWDLGSTSYPFAAADTGLLALLMSCRLYGPNEQAGLMTCIVFV